MNSDVRDFKPDRRDWFRHLWIIVTVLMFGVIYLRSLTFVYVTRDDASSIAYHALERKPSIYPPYSPYQGGMDVILTVLPAQEKVLRIGGMLLTSIATVVVCLCMFELIFRWMGDINNLDKCVIAIALMFAMPELFYLGLVYTPTMVAMACVLTAHLLIWELWTNARSNGQHFRKHKYIYYILSALVFGFGASCRWDVVLYWYVIFLDYLVSVVVPRRGTRQRSAETNVSFMIWSSAVFASWLGFIWVSGYGFREMLMVLAWAGRDASEGEVTLKQLVLLQSVFTPLLITMVVAGITLLWRKNRAKLLFGCLGFAPAIFWFYWSPPKGYIMFVPPLGLLFAIGIHRILRLDGPRLVRFVVVVCVIALGILPWVVGINATYGDTAWGPSFELRSCARPAQTIPVFKFVLSSGSAIASGYGPRGFWGHAHIFLGGEWRRLVRTLSNEVRAAITTSAEQNLPIIVIAGSSGTMVAEMAGLGFLPAKDGFPRRLNKFLDQQVFSDCAGRSLSLLKLRGGSKVVLENQDVVRMIVESCRESVMVVNGLPSTLRALHLRAPTAIMTPGKTICIVNWALFARLESPLIDR